MIIRGNPGGNVMFWSKHLMRDDTNERAVVKEIRGLVADNIQDALWEMRWVAAGSRSHGNFMYQANINPLAHEHLTPEQWMKSVDTLEKNLHLEGHQRVVIEHVKNGRQHYHVVWNRVDADTMRVVDMKGNYHVHKATQRELELEFGLEPALEKSSARKGRLQLWESRAAERSGIDPKHVERDATAAYRTTDNGKALVAALADRDYIVARGDRRDFVIVDRAGDAHSLARRIDGVTTKELRSRMADVDREALPTVGEARALQRGCHANEGHSRSSEQSSGPSPILVVDAVTGVIDRLGTIIADFFCGGSSVPHVPRQDLPHERSRLAQAAMERIHRDYKAERPLQLDDVRCLTPFQHEQIRDKGEDYLRRMMRQWEEERTRDHGRERER